MWPRARHSPSTLLHGGAGRCARSLMQASRVDGARSAHAGVKTAAVLRGDVVPLHGGAGRCARLMRRQNCLAVVRGDAPT